MSMPRSLADRSSLSRGSVITGRSDAISVGSAVTRHWVNSVSDIYGPDEIEELLEDLNRLEMASFDGVMMFDQASMPGGGNGPDGDRDDLSQDRMRPTSSEINMMQNEAVISGCITQPPDDDVEDFDIDGSQVKKQRRQQFDGGGGGHNDPTAAYYSRHSSHLPSRDPAHAVPDHATSATAAAAALNSQPQISSSRELSTANDNYDFTSNNGNRKYSHRRSHRRGSSSWSVRSWDSHAHYQDYPDEEDGDEGGLGGGGNGNEDGQDNPEGGLYPSSIRPIVCYCDMSTFKTPRTILRVLLVVTSIACLSTVLTAGTAKMGLFALPHFPRLRIMMFITVFTVIFTVFILFLNISHLYTFFPVDYGKMQTVAYLLLTVAYAVASTLVFEAHTDNSITPSLHNWTKTQTLIVALLGFTCAFETLLCSFNCGRPPMNTKTHYDKMAESSTHFTLHETMTTNQSRAVTDDSLQQKQMSSRPSGNSAPGVALGNARGEQQHGQPPRLSQPQHQYLVNENYDKSEGNTTARSHKSNLAGQSKTKNGGHQSGHQPLPQHQQGNPSRTSGVITAKATVEHGQQPQPAGLCNKNTGAIPKHKGGAGTASSSSAGTSTSQQVNVNKQQPSVINKPSTNHLDEIVTLPLDDTTAVSTNTRNMPGTQQHHDPLTMTLASKRNGSSGVKDLPLSK